MKNGKIKLFYMYGSYEIVIKIFGDGTNVKAALNEAEEWCKENYKIKNGYYYYTDFLSYDRKVHSELC